MNVLVTGASGFVGNHVVKTLLDAGHAVVGLSRTSPRGERKLPGATYIDGIDVADASTLPQAAFSAVDAVVHLVGIIMERGPKQRFERIHIDGTRNMVEAAKRGGVRRFVYLSAIGASPDAAALYSRTKYGAERLVQSSGMEYVILRPSIILGGDGEFVAQMRDLVLHGGLPLPMPFPIIPVPGNGKNRFQPIFIDDLTTCIRGAVEDGATTNTIVEVGGADRVTFDALLDGFAARERVRKPKLHAPIPILALAAPLVALLPNPPFSADQLKNLKKDNVADIGPMQKAFRFTPIGFEEAMDRVYAASDAEAIGSADKGRAPGAA